MGKKIIVLILLVLFVQSSHGLENKKSIYYEFNDSINAMLNSYIEAEFPEAELICEFCFKQRDDANYLLFYFYDKLSGFTDLPETNRFLKIDEKTIPVYFNFDGDLYQNPYEYRQLQQGQFHKRRSVITIYDGDFFEIDLNTGNCRYLAPIISYDNE